MVFQKSISCLQQKRIKKKRYQMGEGGVLNIIAIKFIHLTVATCISMKSTAMEKEDYLYVR